MQSKNHSGQGMAGFLIAIGIIVILIPVIFVFTQKPSEEESKEEKLIEEEKEEGLEEKTLPLFEVEKKSKEEKEGLEETEIPTKIEMEKDANIAAEFTVARWTYDSSKLQIFGRIVMEGEITSVKLDGSSDDTYTTSNRYCGYDGNYYDYPDAWDIERKHINDNKYRILVRGGSESDCGKGQPQNTGWIQLNPENDWKITQVSKCSISEDTKSSNGILIDTYCRVNNNRKAIEWQSGSNCGGCCACPNGAGVDIEFTIEKSP